MHLVYLDPDPFLRAVFCRFYEGAADSIALVTDEEQMWSALDRKRPDAVVLRASAVRKLSRFAWELQIRCRHVPLVVLTEGELLALDLLPENTHLLYAPGSAHELCELLGERRTERVA